LSDDHADRAEAITAAPLAATGSQLEPNKSRGETVE
jgi:hypothetical protein